MWKGWSSIALVALVAAAAGLAQTGAGHAFLQRAGLFQPPVSYTTLAFAHPESLPIQLKSRHASLNVSFVIHNVSRSSHAYHWSILVVRAGRSHREAAGALQVPGEGRATVSRTVNRKCVGGGLRLVVRLATPPESVDFLATCS
ncbi:MAG TPA: hypothetical protein VF933_14165, partial [Streptosporangiaceae bacterium]